MDRRAFLKLSIVSSAALTSQEFIRGEGEAKEFVGLLVDTTRCIGCRACEVACAEAHGFPVPDVENDSALEQERRTTEDLWSIVNRYETDAGTVYVKKQCMQLLAAGLCGGLSDKRNAQDCGRAGHLA